MNNILELINENSTLLGAGFLTSGVALLLSKQISELFQKKFSDKYSSYNSGDNVGGDSGVE